MHDRIERTDIRIHFSRIVFLVYNLKKQQNTLLLFLCCNNSAKQIKFLHVLYFKTFNYFL